MQGILDEKQQKMIEKVRKLLDLSTSHEPAEAAAAAAKINDIVQQYNLDLASIKGAPKHSFITRPLVISEQRNWLRHLLTVISRHNFCEALWIRGTRRCTVVGDAVNVEVVIELFESLSGALQTMQTQHYALHKAAYNRRALHPVKYRSSFFQGAVDTILLRLQQQKVEFETHNENATALIVNNSNEIATFIKDEVAAKVTPRNTRSEDINALAYQDGIIAGTTVALNKAIEGAK